MENLPRISIGLANFQACLEELGLYQPEAFLIHVGGTNGKGSTVNYLSGILEKNYQVATFQTPELIERHDIIQINHQPITSELFEQLYLKYAAIIDRYNLCVFEAELIVALSYFSRFKLDFIIIEVGLGGTKDPTNVLTYDLAAITNVSLDHQEFLGDTVDQIAHNKAGIIKNGTPVVTGATQPEVLDIFANRSASQGSQLQRVQPYRFEDGVLTYKNYRLTKIDSYYQVKNIVLVLEIVDFLRLQGIQLENYDIIEAIENSKLLGRFTRVAANLIVDGAHNVAGIKELIGNLERLDRPLVVFNCFKDKDYLTMYGMLKAAGYPVIIYYDDNERSIGPAQLQGPHIERMEQLERILNAAPLVVVCGSLRFCLKVYQALA